MPDLDWDDFRLFAIVARQGSYTRAAKKLRMTQSAVSRRIARLEKSIGARLFDRVPQGIALTSQGGKLLKYANSAEDIIDRAKGSVREAVNRVEGDCKLLMGDGLAGYWMPPFQSAFFDRNSSVTLQIFTAHDLSGNFTPPYDIQIQYKVPMETDRVAVRAGTIHFVLCASAAYVQRMGVPKTVADLVHHRLGDTTPHLGERGALSMRANLDLVPIITTNSSAALGGAIEDGTVMGLMPTYMPVLNPALVPVMADTFHFDAAIYICFERETGSKPAVRATIDFLKEYVFDRQRMPWFFNHFLQPQKDWKRIYDSCLTRASEELSQQAATGS
ncbi:MAG TPA: LysR family transcriptional regulator [Rhizomicrobium sp.]|nr:LysR family transcriptional regulator [Rhizomicrobium sp.]